MIKGKFLFFVFSIFFVFNTLSMADTPPIIDIQGPSLRKIPLAIPEFIYIEDSQAFDEIKKKGVLSLAEIIDFSAYFKIDKAGDRKDFPRLDGLVASRIRFDIWKKEGVELLTSVGLAVSREGQLEMECRLFDIIQENMIFGKKYKGPVENYREMFKLFAGEILYQLFGLKGLYESRIAFVSDSSGHKEIYTSDYDGTNIKQITRDKSINLSPAWSSDGNWLAYTSYVKNNPDLYILHLGSAPGAIVSKPGLNVTPAWFPGAFQLAATLSFDGRQNIYMLTGHGKIIKKLTNSWDIDVSPAFSPDGKQMAFVSKRSGSPQIYIMDMDSENVFRLSYEGNYNTSPNFSPDGKYIVFVGMRRGEGMNIYKISLVDGSLTQLTRNSGDNEEPCFSPDGSLIAFASSRRDRVFKIYVMTAYGTDQRLLLSMPGSQTTPRWSLKPVSF